MSLKEYARKRDFKKTAEPRGAVGRKKNGALRFVIQKHDASRLHYDFRLELGGTLKSWAVPKGMPYAKGEKRLAMEVEDHPIEYGEFEGVIPKGQYGGGTVMLWDTGTYEPLTKTPEKDLANGKLHMALHGKKLEGEWHLVRMKGRDSHEWLLIKSERNVRPVSKAKDDQSVATGRTMAQISRAQDAKWDSNRSENGKTRKTAKSAPASNATTKKKPKRKTQLDFVEPMKATLVTAPPTRGEWEYELKFDGYRALILKDGSDVRLMSRNGKDFTLRFPEIADAAAELPVETAILDGEICALDDAGRPTFQLLQGLEMRNRPPIVLYLFDLLQKEGSKLASKPLTERRKQLAQLLKGVSDPIRYSATIPGEPQKLLEEVRRRGLEGIIGKEISSHYQPGQRSREWIKLKCVLEQEFVIGGFTPPEGTRKHFGALLVGHYGDGGLQFAGKVGTGFNAAMLRDLHQRMRALSRDTCPFVNLPEKKQGRWSQNITPREMSRCKWAEPRLVCQVRFTEWTDDGKLRHPAFLGLREDKDPTDVVREIPAKRP